MKSKRKHLKKSKKIVVKPKPKPKPKSNSLLQSQPTFPFHTKPSKRRGTCQSRTRGRSRTRSSPSFPSPQSCDPKLPSRFLQRLQQKTKRRPTRAWCGMTTRHGTCTSWRCTSGSPFPPTSVSLTSHTTSTKAWTVSFRRIVLQGTIHRR